MRPITLLTITVWAAQLLISTGFCIEITVTTNRVDRNGNGKPEQVTVEHRSAGKLVEKHITGDKNEDGIPDVTAVTLYVDGKLAFYESWESGSNIRMRHTFSRGNLMLAEYDRHNDGSFELIVVYDQDEEIACVFERNEDGQTKIAAEAIVADLKRGHKGELIPKRK